jgi:RNA polymerase sigma factor (sigma-70 family)
MKNKKIAIKSAPFYSVLGSLKKGTELSIRVIPLTRARQKEDNWIYPSSEGNKSIPVSNIDKVDSSDFFNKKAIRKFYRGYCFKSGINEMIELIKSTHASPVKKPVPIVALVTPIKKEVVLVTPVKKEKAEKPKIDKVEISTVVVATVSGKKFSKIDQADIDAVNSILSGNKEKFSVLYKRYYPIINYKYSSSLKFNKELAEDLTADLFIRVFNNLESFKPEYTFNSWITRVAHNFLIDYTRKQKLDTVSMDANTSSDTRNDESEFMVFQIRDDFNLTPEEDIITREKNQIVKEAIDSLDENCRNAMNKLYLEEKSYVEIAEEMGLTLGSVKSIIFRSKAKLKTMLEENKSALAAVMA